MSTFPLVSDLEATWLQMLGQEEDEQGTWGTAQVARAANSAYKTVWRQVSDHCSGVFLNETDLSVSSGENVTQLPADFATFKEAQRLGPDGIECGHITVVTVSEAGRWYGRDAFILFPLGYQGATTASLRWAGRCTSEAIDFRIWYEPRPLHLLHGCLQSGGGGQLVLAKHEPTGACVVGQTFETVAGTGCGQVIEAASWNGCLKLVVPTEGLASTVDPTTRYSSRPHLPIQMEEAFHWESIVQLAYGLQDERLPDFKQERDRKFEDLPVGLELLQRSDQDTITDDTGTGSFGDPAGAYYGSGRSFGRR